MICWLLLAGFLVAAALMWRTLSDVAGRATPGAAPTGCSSSEDQPPWPLLLLMLMVAGNTQAAVAPLMLTLLYG